MSTRARQWTVPVTNVNLMAGSSICYLARVSGFANATPRFFFIWHDTRLGRGIFHTPVSYALICETWIFRFCLSFHHKWLGFALLHRCYNSRLSDYYFFLLVKFWDYRGYRIAQSQQCAIWSSFARMRPATSSVAIWCIKIEAVALIERFEDGVFGQRYE